MMAVVENCPAMATLANVQWYMVRGEWIGRWRMFHFSKNIVHFDEIFARI